MKSWYNNTLDDTVSTSVTATKQDVDWMNANRFSPTETQYASLYIASSLVKHANFPGIVGYASTKNIKMGRSWVSQYTLEPHMIESTKAANDEPYDKLNPFDIRNAKGIFSKAEYASMNAQAIRLFGRKPTNEITNNQFI